MGAHRGAVAEYKETLASILGGRFDGASDEDKQHAINQLIATCSAAAGAVALQPLPVVDLFLITPVQVAMVQGIARVYGCPSGIKTVLEVLRAIRISLLVQEGVIAAAKFVPGPGWVVAASVANASTYAIGRLTDRYFRQGRSTLPPEMRATVERIYKERLACTYREKRRAAEALWRRVTQGGRRPAAITP
jgi:uncharacterized protein (DUF697 family)